MRFAFSGILSKLNPLNSLFGRLFVWFWLTSLCIIIGTFLVVRHILTSDGLQSIPAPEQTRLEQVASDLQISFSDLPGLTIEQHLRRIGQKHQVGPILLSHTEDRIYANRNLPSPLQERFFNLKGASLAYGFLARNRLFFGPEIVNLQGKDYSLFLGTRPRVPLFAANRSYLLFLAFAISASLCFILAWSLSRPIQRLRSASQAMASGNLNAKVENIGNRQDEIGALSRDFNAMSDKVNQLVQGQKRLLADISHELRSPLTRLQLAIGIAQDGIGNFDQKLLTRIAKEAEQIDSMLAKVLQLSRLEAKQQLLHKQKTPLAPFIRNLIQDAQYEASHQGKNVTLENLPNATVEIDPELISSAIENVLRNAIRYAQQNINFDSTINDNQLYVTIEDDGCGVPESELDKLLQPFYRVSEARNRSTGGTGLGLAIAMQAIKAHHGEINASIASSGGLRVELSLPVSIQA